MVVNSNEPLQLGLLPNFDVPMGLLKQRPTKASRSLQKLDFKATEEQLQFDCAAKAIAEDKQSHHCSTTVQPLSVWE